MSERSPLARVAELLTGPPQSLWWDVAAPRDTHRGRVGTAARDADISTLESSENMLARRFAEQHASDLRYVAAWGKWLRWTGARWEPDKTLRVVDLVRQLCEAEAARVSKPAGAKSLGKARTIMSIEGLARSDPRLAATVEQWDADSWVINTPGGVVDLRSGELRPHRPGDYCAKSTAVAPGGQCPRWQEFLAEITDADPDLMDYLQRLCGYSLTGDTREHALFFAYGTGANGKSVFLSTLAGILQDYHRTAAVETFTASPTAGHPTDVAGLIGARLVTAIETEEGRKWAESKIKTLTGGDRISARFMRQDFFEFTPQFKLFVAGNHRPGLRSVDESIRRRFHLLPFNVTFPAERRDLGLCDRLRDEWPGILAWAIAGCLKWQRTGLRPPQAVLAATADYLESEDSMAAWIADRCELGANHVEPAAALYASWRAWAELSGEFIGSAKAFGQKLASRGFEATRIQRKTVRAYRGLRLIDGDAGADR